MTPGYLHRFAIKLSPHIPKLIGTFVLLAIMDGLAWYAASQNHFGIADQNAFFILAIPHLGLIWCGGLLVIYGVFRKLPDRNDMNVLVYHWNNIMSYPMALIFFLWLVGLTVLTLVLPVIMVYKFITE
ncbi:MAG: hypothetical protein AB2535_09805 [Candidatus Thiodiazotropha endolucinida]